MKFLDYDGLIYHSNKLKAYISNKINTLTQSISALGTKVDSDKLELENKITDTETSILNTVDIKVSETNTKVDSNYNELRGDIDAADFRPTGDTIKINNIEQLVFKDIAAGETITIPHPEDNSDFLIEVFAKTELTTPLVHKVIDINLSTANQFEYDPRYVEITDAGAKPKDNTDLALTKVGTIDGYSIYSTELLPIELIDNITSINSYVVELNEVTP